MAAVKRTRGERDADLRVIESLYLKGWSYRRIATEISSQRAYTLTHQIIYRDIKSLLDEWRKGSIERIEQAKAGELAKISKLEATYWDAWERSIQEAKRSTMERKDGRGGSEERAIVTRLDMLGDPRYLQGIQWCIEKRCAILGLDAPIKVDEKRTYAVKLPQDWGQEAAEGG